MTFDKPEHQKIVAQMIQQANFPGSLIEIAIELKQAVASATVAELHDKNPADSDAAAAG